jgi:hypothetical protein
LFPGLAALLRLLAGSSVAIRAVLEPQSSGHSAGSIHAEDDVIKKWQMYFQQ